MLKWLAKWHPMARLPILFVLAFVWLQGCYIVIVLTLPTTFNTTAATALLVFLPMWTLTAGISTAFLFYNAFRLSRMFQRRYKYAPVRNLVVAWLAPFLLIGIIAVVTTPVYVRSLFEYRRDLSFNASRDEMLVVCDDIIADGPGSSLIRSNTEVGIFSNVRISLRNENQVWFDVGDDTGEFGYVCVTADAEPLADDDTYIIESRDERFYFFRERDEARIERLNEEDSE